MMCPLGSIFHNNDTQLIASPVQVPRDALRTKWVKKFVFFFQIYTKISDKVVGLLIAAKRRGFVYFDREILFQVSVLRRRYDREYVRACEWA